MDNLPYIKVGQPEFFELKKQVTFYQTIFETKDEIIDFLVETGLDREVAFHAVQGESRYRYENPEIYFGSRVDLKDAFNKALLDQAKRDYFLPKLTTRSSSDIETPLVLKRPSGVILDDLDWSKYA